MRASDLAEYLAANGIGVLAKTIYYSSMPAAPDDVVVVNPTGGFAPDMELPLASPTFQIRIRAKAFEDAEAKANAVYALFTDEQGRAKCNFSIGDTHIYYAKWMQEPTTAFIGYDANERAEYSLNLHLRIRRD